MPDSLTIAKKSAGRRSFLKTGLATGVAGAGAAVLANTKLFSQTSSTGSITKGDAALLRFAAAAEILEADFWIQYNELGGIQDSEVPGGSGNPAYTAKLELLDEDFSQYIHDNTDDEITHNTFLNAYLESKGEAPANLDQFRTLPGSTATGSSGIPRLTNLTQLTLDTSWYTRYRDDSHNPDLDPNHVFPQAVPGLHKGQFTAIPRTDDDLTPDAHLQAIANTAAFHMPTIEQGGNSLYPSMAQRASSVEVLRILISIGPTETMHFQTWSDIAGAAVDDPIAPLTDPTNGLTFPNLNDPPFGGELFTTNLIMPEPCPFLSRKLPRCSVIRPTNTKNAAQSVVRFLTDMGLFIGQPQAFHQTLHQLAAAADAAQRGM
ncbi:MAG TPA: ferritin-like domain-containing protein [Candidatus Sulfotelmatobacter sp.]|nr:ferritin-like domain-containing protein [Candidatus Sulfotelmatobacter sp.]